MRKTTVVLILIDFVTYIVQGTDIDSPCDANNWGAYECIQYLQQHILELQELHKNLTNKVNGQSEQLSIQSAQLNETKFEINALHQNPIPVGFIYVQLPSQQEPYQVCDNVYWVDITYEYAGLFFRVLGGGSAQFGVTQEADSPRLTGVGKIVTACCNNNIAISPNGGWSSVISTGSNWSLASYWGLRFSQSSTEVRPRNKAVRIWKRTD